MATLTKQSDGTFRTALNNLSPTTGFNVFGFLGDLLKPKQQPVTSTPTYSIPANTKMNTDLSYQNKPVIPPTPTKQQPVIPKPVGNITTPSSNNSTWKMPEVNTENNQSTTNTQQNQNPTTNFTDALMKILKDAQSGQQAGQAGLMKQQQDITGQGLDMANQINTQNIEQLNPESIVGLRKGAIASVNPGELSVENQIKLSNAGFANVNDLIDKTLGSYNKEQDRNATVTQNQADQAFKERQLAETIRSNKATEGINASKVGATGVSSTGAYVIGSNPTVDAWASRINSGQAKLSDITGAGNVGIKNQVVRALDTMNQGKLGPVQQNLKDAKAIVDTLITHPGRTGATGTMRIGTIFGGTEATDFAAQVDRLNSLLFLNAVPQMKGMGQLTEREGAKLESSASTLSNRKQSEGAYLDELKKLQTKLASSITNLGGDETQGGKILSMNGQSFDASDLSPEEYQQALSDGFSEQ